LHVTSSELELAYGDLPVMIWTAGPDQACDYVNERWLEFSGRGLEAELGFGWTDLVHPEDRSRCLTQHAQAVQLRRPFTREYRMRRADGQYRRLRDSAVPRHDSAGEFIGFLGCCADVTDQGAPEQRASAEERVNALASLAGGVAHDFNNLLTGILWHVTMLEEDAGLGPQARADLEQIRQSVERATGVTRQLLALGRRQALAPRALDLNQMLREAKAGIQRLCRGVAQAASLSPEETVEGHETILLAEDERPVRELARRVLHRAGYTVLEAGSAEAAIALADRHPGEIHLLISDMVLPRLSGRELAARLGIHRPTIKVLYISGTTDGAIARHRLLDPGTEFLEKPFPLDRLLARVRRVLDPVAGQARP
jgi:PAS domain S-box-containing protein